MLVILPYHDCLAQLHEFTTQDGKKFFAEIVSATASEAMLATGPTFSTSKRTAITTLVAADQAYLADWRKSRAMLGKIPIQFTCWREKKSSVKITDGNVRHLVGHIHNSKFYSSRSSIPSENMYEDDGYPGIVTKQTFQVGASITLRGGTLQGPVEIEGEIYHEDLLERMVVKKDVKATGPVLGPGKQVTVNLIQIVLNHIELTKDSKGKAKVFAGGRRTKEEKIEHINLRIVVNGMVIGQFVASDVPELK